MIRSDYFNAHSLANYLAIIRAFAPPTHSEKHAAAAAAPASADQQSALGGGRPCAVSESEWAPTIASVKTVYNALSGTLQVRACVSLQVCRGVRFLAGGGCGLITSRTCAKYVPCIPTLSRLQFSQRLHGRVQLVVKGRNLHCVVGAKLGDTHVPSADVCAESPLLLRMFHVLLPRHLPPGTKTVRDVRR